MTATDDTLPDGMPDGGMSGAPTEATEIGDRPVDAAGAGVGGGSLLAAVNDLEAALVSAGAAIVEAVSAVNSAVTAVNRLLAVAHTGVAVKPVGSASAGPDFCPYCQHPWTSHDHTGCRVEVLPRGSRWCRCGCRRSPGHGRFDELLPPGPHG